MPADIEGNNYEQSFTRGGGVASPEVLKVLEWFKNQINSNKGIVEEYHDDLGFYVKFAGGLIVQGGALTVVSTQTITFHTPFSGVAYSLALLPILIKTGTSWGEAPREMSGTRTTSSVSVWVNGITQDRTGSWLAIGY